ncbi:MAG: DNA adenine methylase [Oscillospiraceae bacterium]|nr:DNA adenine methylase [Oscillospiraceae bacterium]
MANVVVENQDFETLIRHYDRPDAFFYLDPPYYSSEHMYVVEFGWDALPHLIQRKSSLNT